MEKTTNIAVIGGGSWATAIVKILSANNVKINWWLRSSSHVEHLEKFGHNPNYLSSVKIDLSKVSPTSDIKSAVKNAEYVVVVVPAAYVKEPLSQLSAKDLAGKKIVSAVKGIIPSENCLVTEYMESKMKVDKKDVFVIVGPCHAEEVALEKQSYLTIGCEDLEEGEKFAALMRCRFVNVSLLQDAYGAEYCAVMKNIIALGCGMAHGIHYGDNFQAVLVSNALQEIERFLNLVCPLPGRNLLHSAYMGDLLVTSYSQFSRNRTLGNMVGRGYSVRSALMEMGMVAEGYYAVKGVHEQIKNLPIDMPITRAVYNVLYEGISAVIEFQILKNKLK